MKKFFIFVLFACMMASCNGQYSGVPEQYHKLLDEALAKAGANRQQIETALQKTPADQKEGMAFLIAYMPERDLATLGADYLLKNVSLAYEARNRFPWAAEVPMELFLNDVLPYANANETRDDWREDFYNRFAPYVENCKTLKEAAYAVNSNVHGELGVEYSTARRRADQSPTESLEIEIASCTGLSILLTDAFRSVGIPSRLAGTIWSDDRGNHTWSEVWVDGQWYFSEYYFVDLDRAWFLSSAGKAMEGHPKYAIRAASYKPTGQVYDLPWHSGGNPEPAIEVTSRYLDIYNTVSRDNIADGNHVSLRIKMFRDKDHVQRSEDRVKMSVDVFQGDLQIGGGSTAGPTQDMNDVLEFIVEKNKEYTVKYFPPSGEKSVKVRVGDTPAEVVIFP